MEILLQVRQSFKKLIVIKSSFLLYLKISLIGKDISSETSNIIDLEFAKKQTLKEMLATLREEYKNSIYNIIFIPYIFGCIVVSFNLNVYFFSLFPFFIEALSYYIADFFLSSEEKYLNTEIEKLFSDNNSQELLYFNKVKMLSLDELVRDIEEPSKNNELNSIMALPKP